MPGMKGFSPANLKYISYFYKLYAPLRTILQRTCILQIFNELQHKVKIVRKLRTISKTDIDNPTIGLLICKDKDNVVAKYALESYKEPMGISEYQLSKLFPKDFKSSMPTIEELEKGLKDNQKQRNCFCMNKEEIKQEPNDGLIARILGGCFNCLDCHRLKYRLLDGNFLQYKSFSSSLFLNLQIQGNKRVSKLHI